MGDEQEKDLVAVPSAPWQILFDLMCVQCGFNLRGLQSDGRCPECGVAIGQTLRGETLRFANRRWVTMLRVGIALALATLGLAPGNLVVEIKGGWEMRVLWIGAEELAGFAAVWCLSAQEPRLTGRERWGSLRRWLRLMALLQLGAILLAMAAGMGSGRGQQWMLLAALILQVAAMPQLCLFFAYLERLADRIPDHVLASRCGLMMWMGAIPLPLIVMTASMMPWRWIRYIAACLVMPYLMLVMIGCGVVLWKFWLRLRVENEG